MLGCCHMPPVTIEQAFDPTAEIRDLVAELDRWLQGRYPAHQQHGLTLEALFAPHVRFFVARAGGVALGCGGVAMLDGFAEVKRMYVRAAFRGQGVAVAIMARLEAEAAASGRRLLRLEMGARDDATLRFYSRRGFRPCAAFAPYTSLAPETTAASLFLEKVL